MPKGNGKGYGTAKKSGTTKSIKGATTGKSAPKGKMSK